MDDPAGASPRTSAMPTSIIMTTTDAGIGEAVVVAGFVREHHGGAANLPERLAAMGADGSLQRLVGDYRERERRRAEVQALAARGVVATQPCPRCSGTGADAGAPCYFCRATGRTG
ncbi:hypothetical protein [Nocardiopsis trehalosi]|jgi:hypothetical protein|uniref:hypothetical protein n=1 Tax=Nocardiopsis trehalosi TaxID=109329 RepID=UPI0008307495|nr:hypothetical protein [Nocardiopsis trehalosi]